jgi:hypothetical protein
VNRSANAIRGRPCSALSRALRAVPAGVLLVTALYLATLALGVHTFDQFAGWFWPLRELFLPEPELVVAVALLPAIALVVFGRRLGSVGAKLALLVVLGVANQQGLALLEGHGFDALPRSMLRSGHAELLHVAAGVRDAPELVTHFEARAESGALGNYARSKPPGELLLYVATFRAANAFRATDDQPTDDRVAVERAAAFAAIVWPWSAYLAVVPLFFLTRRFMSERGALAVAVAYTLVPSIDLVVLHTDEAFFPLLAVTVAWLAASSVEQGNERRAVFAGVLAYLAAFCSFALLLVVPIAAAFAHGRLDAGANRVATLRRVGARFVAAFVTMSLVGFVLFRYDPLSRGAHALAFHAAWKPRPGGFRGRYYFALLDGIEFALWTGIPVFALAVGDVGRSLRRVLRGSTRGLAMPALTVAAMVTFAAFFGEAKAETARLWAFFVPFVVVLAVARLERFGERFPIAFASVAAFEWATTLLTKLHQDFW